jgi:putative transposase
VQTCIVHVRDTFRLASKRDWPALKRDLTLDLHRRQRHHHAGRVRRPDRGLGATGTARSFGCGTTPGKSPSEFLDYDVEIRPGAVLHERDRVPQRPLPARGQGSRPLPHRTAAQKCLYLVTRSLDPTGTGQPRWTMRWKPALNAFAITFSDRFPAAETYKQQPPETPLARQSRPAQMALRSMLLWPGDRWRSDVGQKGGGSSATTRRGTWSGPTSVTR